MQALDKAREAARKERMLCKQREQAQLSEQINLDLTYCVRLYLIIMLYHAVWFSSDLISPRTMSNC